MSTDDRTAAHLLRVTADDPEYLRQAAAEAAFWEQVHPLGLEAGEDIYVEGPVEQYVNERFTSLRRRMQLERAIGLLRSGTSVKEAALGAGFSEPAYFSRVFARRFGVPPSRWREALD